MILWCFRERSLKKDDDGTLPWWKYEGGYQSRMFEIDDAGMLLLRNSKEGWCRDAPVKEVWRRMMLGCFCEGRLKGWCCDASVQSLKMDDIGMLLWRRFDGWWCWNAPVKEVWRRMTLKCSCEGSLKMDDVGMLRWRKFEGEWYWDSSGKEVWRRMMLGCFCEGSLKKDDVGMLLWRKLENDDFGMLLWRTFKRMMLWYFRAEFEKGWCWDASMKEVWRRIIFGCFSEGSWKSMLLRCIVLFFKERCLNGY